MRVDELRALVARHTDDDVVDLFLAGDTGAVGTTTAVMPGVPGLVIRKAGGHTQVRVKVRNLRHTLRLLNP
jgi:hypothetical protein